MLFGVGVTSLGAGAEFLEIFADVFIIIFLALYLQLLIIGFKTFKFSLISIAAVFTAFLCGFNSNTFKELSLRLERESTLTTCIAIAAIVLGIIIVIIIPMVLSTKILIKGDYKYKPLRLFVVWGTFIIVVILGSTGFIESIANGDLKRVKFGTYEQDGIVENGAEPLMWDIISKDETSVTLITKYIIDVKPYANSNSNEYSWDTSSLRQWLEEYFYNVAFTETEQAQIIDYHTTSGLSGTVRLLFQSELRKYDDRFKNIDTTENVNQNYESILENNDSWLENAWWIIDGYPAFVTYLSNSYFADMQFGVRPVITIKR